MPATKAHVPTDTHPDTATVRDFVELVNLRAFDELAPFLCEDIVYRAGRSDETRGLPAVVQMLRTVGDVCDHFHLYLGRAATGRHLVFVEHVLTLGVSHHLVGRFVGFSVFRLRDGRIAEWSQTQTRDVTTGLDVA